MPLSVTGPLRPPAEHGRAPQEHGAADGARVTEAGESGGGVGAGSPPGLVPTPFVPPAAPEKANSDATTPPPPSPARRPVGGDSAPSSPSAGVAGAPATGKQPADDWLKGTFFDPNGRRMREERERQRAAAEAAAREAQARRAAEAEAAAQEAAAAEARRAAAAARMEEERRRKAEVEARKEKKREKARLRKEEEAAAAAAKAARKPAPPAAAEPHEPDEASAAAAAAGDDVLARANVEAAVAAAAAARDAAAAGDQTKAARMAAKAARLAPAIFASLPDTVAQRFKGDGNPPASEDGESTAQPPPHERPDDAPSEPQKRTGNLHKLVKGLIKSLRTRYRAVHASTAKAYAKRLALAPTATEVIAHASLALVGCVLAYATWQAVRFLVWATGVLVWFAYDTGLRIPLDLLVFNPTWFVTLPLCFGMALQRSYFALAASWPFLLLFWMCGGGYYSLAGGMLAFLAIALRISSFWTFLPAWYVIGWSHYYLPWYLWIPIWLLTAAAYVLFGTGGPYARQPPNAGLSDSEVLLVTEVPKGAEGEIARVLACDDYFKVLEILELPTKETAKGQAVDFEKLATLVKKQHRRKIIQVHPDKNQGAVGCEEACRRVQTASEVLGDEARLQEYAARLYAIRTGGVSASASSENGASPPSADKPRQAKRHNRTPRGRAGASASRR